VNNWIHWIGRSYYTEASFIAEAQKYGITRRIDRRVAARMNYGDVIYLAINDGASGVVFGKFVLRSLSGLSMSESLKVSQRYQMTVIDSGGTLVQRGCGSYTTGSSCVFVGQPPSMNELLEVTAETKDKGNLMVGGDLILLPRRVRVKDMRLSQGFRPFDAPAFIAAVEANKHRASGPVPVKGYFYVSADAPESNVIDLDSARVQVVADYHRNK
jgi:hypothetical protein